MWSVRLNGINKLSSHMCELSASSKNRKQWVHVYHCWSFQVTAELLRVLKREKTKINSTISFTSHSHFNHCCRLPIEANSSYVFLLALMLLHLVDSFGSFFSSLKFEKQATFDHRGCWLARASQAVVVSFSSDSDVEVKRGKKIKFSSPHRSDSLWHRVLCVICSNSTVLSY